MNKNKFMLALLLWSVGALAGDAQPVGVVAAQLERTLSIGHASAEAQVQCGEGSILKTWALKNVLTSAPDQDLYRSPLLGIIAVENGTLKKWYGECTDVVGDNARFKRTFTSETPSEVITRSFFDQLDGKVRSATLGSNPTIALTSDQVAQWVQLVKTKGIAGFVAVYGKREVKKSGKKVASESDEQKEQMVFLQKWFATYQLRTENGKFSDVGRLRRWTELLCEQLEKLVIEKGEEETQKQFLTLLMAHLYLKDFKESEKSLEYSIANYFKALGIEYHTVYYTKADKEEIEKKVKKGELGETPEALEDMVFYLTSLTKGTYSFLEQRMTNVDYPPSNPHDVPICAETTVRSMFNLMLYNFAKGKFDFSVLPEAVQKTIDPKFRAFFEHHAHPMVPNYYLMTIYEWMDFLSKDVPGLRHGKFIYDLYGSQSNLLKVCNYVFGTSAVSFEELGTMLSTDIHIIAFGPYDTKEKRFTMTVIDIKNDSTIHATIVAKNDTGHTVFSLESDSLYPLVRYKSFEMIAVLQEKYGVMLTPIVFNPSTVNGRGLVSQAGTEALKILLENGACVDTVDEEGNNETVLLSAIVNNNLDKARLLLEYGATNMPNKWGTTPLKVAAVHGHARIVQLMQEKGFTDPKVDINKSLNFYSAIRKNETERIPNLIKSGVIDVNKPNKKGEIPLALAVRLPDDEVARMLIDNGAKSSINRQDQYGMTPLHEAIRANNYLAVELLMAYGADPLISDEEGVSALDLVHEKEFISLLPLLEQQGMSLLEAIKNGYDGKIQEILSVPGVRTDEVDAEGNTALHVALIKKDLKTINLLLKYGIGNSLAIQNDQGQTPLLLLIDAWRNYGDEDGMKLVTAFIHGGADTTVVDRNGNTLLLLAVLKGGLDLIKLLLDHGARASINIPNKKGINPLEASSRWVIDYARLLLEYGSDPRMLSSRTGKSFLQEADDSMKFNPDRYELLKAAADTLEQQEQEAKNS